MINEMGSGILLCMGAAILLFVAFLILYVIGGIMQAVYQSRHEVAEVCKRMLKRG